MKKYCFLVILISLSFCHFSMAQTVIQTDTISLQSGEQSFDINIPHTSYSLLDLSLYIGLNKDCHFNDEEFVSLQLKNQNMDSEIKNVEFARVFLPSFSDHRKLGNDVIYHFDVSLWQEWLMENKQLILVFSGKPKGVKAAISLRMEEGELPIEVSKIIPLWQSSMQGFPYGKLGVDQEKYLPTQDIDLPDEAHSAFISIMVNGLSEKGSQQKQDSRFYFLKVNGQDVAKRSIWREDCGLNPIYPQDKGWAEGRSNWCPGLRVNPLTHYVNDELLKQKKLSVDLSFQKDYQGNSSIDAYVTSAVLFLTSGPHDQLNVSITEILAPNIDMWHHRYNPICGSPVILIQNNGQERVHSITFNYGYNYETDNKYRWKGELGYMEAEIVYLPPLNWYFYDNNDQPESFTVHVSAVNKEEKAFEGGRKTSMMELAEVLPQKLVFEIQTDEQAQSNGFEIFDEDGEAYFISGDLESDSLYKFEMKLIPGCYEMVVYDLDGDGLQMKESTMSCFKIIDAKKETIIKEFSGDFGSEIREQFMIFR
jgi:hypothetical protein